MRDRWLTIVLGASVVALLIALVATRNGNKDRPSASASGSASASASSPTSSTPSRPPSDDAGLFGSLGFAMGAGAPGDSFPTAAPASSNDLPTGSPKMVRFGVVLVQYAGAQGAPASSRSKTEAVRLAQTLAEAARTSFKGAVERGDPGSTDDLGRMPRGVLEPATEFAIFTLQKGAVSDPIDTPRGIWIVRRLE